MDPEAGPSTPPPVVAASPSPPMGPLVLGVVAMLVVAGAVAAGTAYYVVQNYAPAATPDPGKADDKPATNGSKNATGPEWVFVAQGVTRSANAPRDGGSVVVLLARLRGDANQTATNGSIPVEIAAVQWNALNGSATANATILQVLNAAFTQSPPVALTRASLSRAGDAAELTVPQGLGVESVLVNAPESGDFLVLHWATARSFRWTSDGWAEVTNIAPVIVARSSA